MYQNHTSCQHAPKTAAAAAVFQPSSPEYRRQEAAAGRAQPQSSPGAAEPLPSPVDSFLAAGTPDEVARLRLPVADFWTAAWHGMAVGFAAGQSAQQPVPSPEPEAEASSQQHQPVPATGDSSDEHSDCMSDGAESLRGLDSWGTADEGLEGSDDERRNSHSQASTSQASLPHLPHWADPADMIQQNCSMGGSFRHRGGQGQRKNRHWFRDRLQRKLFPGAKHTLFSALAFLQLLQPSCSYYSSGAPLPTPHLHLAAQPAVLNGREEILPEAAEFEVDLEQVARVAAGSQLGGTQGVRLAMLPSPTGMGPRFNGL